MSWKSLWLLQNSQKRSNKLRWKSWSNSTCHHMACRSKRRPRENGSCHKIYCACVSCTLIFLIPPQCPRGRVAPLMVMSCRHYWVYYYPPNSVRVRVRVRDWLGWFTQTLLTCRREGSSCKYRVGVPNVILSTWKKTKDSWYFSFTWGLGFAS